MRKRNWRFVNNINQANDTNNIFSLTKNDKAVFGGVYKAGKKALIENGISIDLINNSIRLYNPSDNTEYKDINYQRDSGTGNYHVLKVEFEANADYETTTVLPVGAQIDKLVIRSSGLTTGTAPLQFLINGSTTVLLAEQGVEFDNTAGTFTIAFFADAIDLIIASGEEGTFKSEWSGAGPGTGAGFAYLFYWTPLP